MITIRSLDCELLDWVEIPATENPDDYDAAIREMGYANWEWLPTDR